ncbi:reverse transcriptase domain-containing protein [Streptomyces coacervatus]|uniref:Reverse transcriptase domain-containing protein n=1 Tax=Streptomyces coacervatus TaxID=647381 RepID=A0ABP7J7H1_9ACTN|nr:reverse transcriptase/maturase family protein [Streptomyces coacervatus]MDF2273549.1 reverse transcriptase domain-containing protein [Streptomyces coacervatus]
MQNAQTVLDILRKRGREGLPLDRLYRQLFNPQLFLLAYGRIYSNHGSMTPGATEETVDGMSLGKIEQIIDALRHERYIFSPARRTFIPKKNGTLRPLGLPSWSDKLVAEVVRMLLDAYYDVQFSDHSHGFRPGRGCHTALREVAETWKGTHWFIEGDIADCFGSLDFTVMLTALGENIHDGRFLALIHKMLTAGYLQDWEWHATLSGAPQGGIASPVLSNIYLHRLDEFVETVLVPEYTRGKSRAANPAYRKLDSPIAQAKQSGDHLTLRKLRQRRRRIPYGNPQDPGYRRLRYVRYCDDFLLGFSGPITEAEEIKKRIRQFLKGELKLELSEAKTLITHARKGARFLGYHIVAQHANDQITRQNRAVNGVIGLRVPVDVLTTKCAQYMERGKPASQTRLLHRSDYNIMARFGAEYRGMVQYYLLASNVHWLNRLHWVMQTSLLKTLAHKHNSKVIKMSRKYKVKIETPEGLRTCLQACVERGPRRNPLVATFGGIPLKRQRTAKIIDRRPVRSTPTGSELIRRLRHGECELCGSADKIQVHHVRKLADLQCSEGPQQPAWAVFMAKKRRKTLVVCAPCHDAIHAGPPATITA